jgi:FAD/FMN-containing dehydrogenase
MTTTDIAPAIQDLAPAFAGRLVLPGHPKYDEVRRVHNGLIDKRPGLIAQCRGIADISDAIGLARRLGLEIAVRGGGHNVGGRGSIDNGVLIDLSLMRSVQIDARARIARVDGGALWREFNRETQLHGLATTGGIVGTTGIAGLTLGGGLGWLMPKHGMALDNLLSVEIVLADGQVLHASPNEYPELFWAVRGGGGNFGVVARFEFHLHELGPMVTGGLVAWPIAQARDVLRHFRELAASANDDTMLVAALLTAPDGVTKLVGVAAGYLGGMAGGEAALRPIKSFGTPAMDMMGPIPYVQLNAMLDAALPRGARNYWKSHFVDQLTDPLIEQLVTAYGACQGPMSQIILEHFHGAATRVPVDHTAFALRSPGFNTLVLGQWMDPAQDAAMQAWTRESYAAIQPFVGSKRYVNYLDADDSAAEKTLSAVYGPNLPRLKKLKRQFDPENVFHVNLNISPA